MARIPDAELARIKAEVSVQRLVEGCGVELRQQGKDLVGKCPFHEDDSPSLVVTPAKNLWHCLGACRRGGGPIDWVMTAQGVSFRHAVELLRGQPVPEPLRASRHGRVERPHGRPRPCSQHPSPSAAASPRIQRRSERHTHLVHSRSDISSVTQSRVHSWAPTGR